MKPNLTDTLCTHCGLCCDGSLFADVELVGTEEASALEILGLEIEDGETGGGLLLQPCVALKDKRCGIYPHRPDCCRAFECRLLRQVRSGVVTMDRAREKIAEALKRIERVRKLLARAGQGGERLPLKERCCEFLARSEEADVDPRQRRKRDQLEAAMTSAERLIQQTFLRG